MKLLTLRMIGTVLLSSFLAFQIHAQETKKVCHEEKGKKVCKEIKVHKKLDGTKVPPK